MIGLNHKMDENEIISTSLVLIGVKFVPVLQTRIHFFALDSIVAIKNQFFVRFKD